MAAMSAYGLPLGEAFQLRDDVLGVFGDPQTTGKPAGDDLREGKQNYLIACAYQTATAVQRVELTEGLGDLGLSIDDIESLRRVIVETGALEQTEARIRSCTESALSALTEHELRNNARDVLESLAIAATNRTH